MKYLRTGICALVMFAVLAYGGVEDWARAVLESGTALLFLAWAVNAYRSKQEQVILSPLLPPLLALLAVVAVQLTFHITASPYQTRVELQLLLAYVLLAFLAAQAFQTLEDWRGFVWFVMLLGFLVATFGILQHLTFNGKIYWTREMRYGGIPFGPYANRNHFAGFVELVLPLSLLPLVMGKVRRERWVLVSLCAVMPLGAVFLSASRGGLISIAAEMGVVALWMVFRRAAGKHLLAGAVVLLVAFLMVSWLGVHQVLERFSSLQSLEVSVGKRASMRQDTWHIFLDHPLLGTGLGTLQTVYPPYESFFDGKIVNHSHNDYLEALAETGIAGGACCAWFLGTLIVEALRRILEMKNSFQALLHLSGLVGCCGILVHSLADFNLHIPANALLFFLMAHLATGDVNQTPGKSRLHRRHRSHRRNE
jgi:O-antigen ligase